MQVIEIYSHQLLKYNWIDFSSKQRSFYFTKSSRGPDPPRNGPDFGPRAVCLTPLTYDLVNALFWLIILWNDLNWRMLLWNQCWLDVEDAVVRIAPNSVKQNGRHRKNFWLKSLNFIRFFKGVLETRRRSLELKIGSLESEKIIKGNIWTDTAIKNFWVPIDPYRAPHIFLKKPWLYLTKIDWMCWVKTLRNPNDHLRKCGERLCLSGTWYFY